MLVTPAEHLRLPDADDVREGIVASKIAAHAAVLQRVFLNARDIDNKMSECQKTVLNGDEMFKYAIEPEKAKSTLKAVPPKDEHTMLYVQENVCYENH